MNTTNTLTAAEVLAKAVAYAYADNLGEAALEDPRAEEVQRRLFDAVRKGYAFIGIEGTIKLTYKGEVFMDAAADAA